MVQLLSFTSLPWTPCRKPSPNRGPRWRGTTGGRRSGSPTTRGSAIPSRSIGTAPVDPWRYRRAGRWRCPGARQGGAGSAAAPSADPVLHGHRHAEGLLVGGRADRLRQDLSLIHISEPTRLGMISYAVFCLKKKKKK